MALKARRRWSIRSSGIGVWTIALLIESHRYIQLTAANQMLLASLAWGAQREEWGSA